MWTSLPTKCWRPSALMYSISPTGMAYAGGGGDRGPSMRGPSFDMTHFDVPPVNATLPTLLATGLTRPCSTYRDASEADPGLSRAFGSSDWLAAPSHSQIIRRSGAASMRSRHIWRNLTAPDLSGLPSNFRPLWSLLFFKPPVSVARSTTASSSLVKPTSNARLDQRQPCSGAWYVGNRKPSGRLS